MNLGGPRSPVAGDKGKGIDVESPQSSSTTPTDPEIFESFEGLEDTADIPPKRRNIEASHQSGTTGAGQSSNVESPPTGRQKKQRRDNTRNTRYGFRKELSASPSPSPSDKATEIEAQPGVVSIDHVVKEARLSKDGQNNEEPEAECRQTFRYQDKILMESDSLSRALPLQPPSCMVLLRAPMWRSMLRLLLFNSKMDLFMTF